MYVLRKGLWVLWQCRINCNAAKPSSWWVVLGPIEQEGACTTVPSCEVSRTPSWIPMLLVIAGPQWKTQVLWPFTQSKDTEETQPPVSDCCLSMAILSPHLPRMVRQVQHSLTSNPGEGKKGQSPSETSPRLAPPHTCAHSHPLLQSAWVTFTTRGCFLPSQRAIYRGFGKMHQRRGWGWIGWEFLFS